MRHVGHFLIVSASVLGCSDDYRLGAARSSGGTPGISPTVAMGGVVASAGEPASAAAPSGGAPTGGVPGGGTAAGGVSAGGSAGSGEAPVSVCATVATLPIIGSSCSTTGESQCTASGRCVCANGIWYCNTICASTYRDEPTPNDDCFAGSACTYPGGVGCTCRSVMWVCSGDDGCPATAPGTGVACTELAGRLCDYPNLNPWLSIACVCSADGGAVDATWACVQMASCPASQPSYPTVCAGLAGCRYGDVFCSCLDAGATWICDWPFIIPPFVTP